MQFQNTQPQQWPSGPEERTHHNSNHKNIRFHKKRTESRFSFSNLLRFLTHAIGRLFTVLKFRLSRINLGSIHLPWFRLIVAGILVYLIFQRDLQFQVQMNAPGSGTTPTMQTTGSTMDLSQNVRAEQADVVPAEPEVAVDPFAAAPGDSEQVRSVKSYIRRFSQVAQAEMEKYGIPASVKMAQAILESNAGSSRLAREGHNHFGMKCFSRSCAPGHCSNFPDDHHKDFFRNYDSAWASWRAHSEMLANGKYEDLLDHGTDYRAWAHGLAELGYATDPAYEEKLINTIETYQLHVLDQS